MSCRQGSLIDIEGNLFKAGSGNSDVEAWMLYENSMDPDKGEQVARC